MVTRLGNASFFHTQPKRYRLINLQGKSSMDGRTPIRIALVGRLAISWSAGCMPGGSSFPFYALLPHTIGLISPDGQEKVFSR